MAGALEKYHRLPVKANRDTPSIYCTMVVRGREGERGVEAGRDGGRVGEMEGQRGKRECASSSFYLHSAFDISASTCLRQVIFGLSRLS